MDKLISKRLRQARVKAGIKQLELAKTIGISPAYLNLIENGHRSINDELLLKVSRALSVDAAYIKQGASKKLLNALIEHKTAKTMRLDEASAQEFVDLCPQWAEIFIDQTQENEDLAQTLSKLRHRIENEPFLEQELHNILSVVTSIRSAAGILQQSEELSEQWLKRFHRNMYEDSQRLAQAAQSLVTYLNETGESLRQDPSLTSPSKEEQ